MDPGSFLTGREAPAPGASSAKVSAKQLVAEYVRGCNRRPPEDFLGHLGRKVNAPQCASAPSSASGTGPWASASGYTPYLNPTVEPTTFGGRL